MHRRGLVIGAVVVCAVFVLQTSALFAQTYSSADFNVVGPVIQSGGYSTSPHFGLQSVIGGIAPGQSSSVDFGNNAGFLYYPYISTPIVSTTAGDSQVSLSWSAASGYLGLNPSSYSYGVSTVSGGPYTFTNSGNALSAVVSGLTNNTTYYFIVKVLDGFGNTIATSTEISGTPSGSNNNGGNGGSGGGGSGGGSGGNPPPAPQGATVQFSGWAYPNESVVLLKDGQIAITTVAGGDAAFQMSLSGLSAGDYIFSVYGIDDKGNKSVPLPFSETLTSGATTNVSGIFISPTISVDKSQVKKGDNLVIFGQAAASSTVTIGVHSNPELFVQTTSGGNGAYLYTFDTSVLDYGSHFTESKAALQNEISSFGAQISFSVGNKDVPYQAQSSCPLARKGDLNCDGHIDLVDFSIMAYCYERSPLPSQCFKADLNRDNTVNLVDFSILASNWTG